MTANDKRAERRVPVALRIRLRYSDVDQFISKFAINISRGGMFLSSRNPKPIGTHLHFEMRLADDSPVIEGSGEVRWIREYDRHHPTQPHGMGIRFFELNADSQVILERIIEHRRSVGEPDTDSIPEPRGPDAPVPMPIQVPAEIRRTNPIPDPIPHPIPAPQEALGERPVFTVESALARARRLASEIMQEQGDLERELSALLDERAVPVEITVEAASQELAERLGGVPVVRRPVAPPDRRGRPPGRVEAPPPPRQPDPVDDTGGSVRVDPADVLEEHDAVGLDVDLSDFASENDIPTSVGDPDDPMPDRATPRAGRGRGRTARG